MTHEEAIKMFRAGKQATECDVKKELYEVAINALEKQIPKKTLRGYTCKANNDSWRSCPFCHARQNNTHKYCSQCGQALDWSDEK